MRLLRHHHSGLAVLAHLASLPTALKPPRPIESGKGPGHYMCYNFTNWPGERWKQLPDEAHWQSAAGGGGKIEAELRNIKAEASPDFKTRFWNVHVTFREPTSIYTACVATKPDASHGDAFCWFVEPIPPIILDERPVCGLQSYDPMQLITRNAPFKLWEQKAR